MSLFPFRLFSLDLLRDLELREVGSSIDVDFFRFLPSFKIVASLLKIFALRFKPRDEFKLLTASVRKTMKTLQFGVCKKIYKLP
jgi:hypothetical protein